MDDLTMEVRGQKYPVTVKINSDGKGAWFEADIGTSHNPTSTTWEGLYKAAMLATKRPNITVNVPVMEYLARTDTFRTGIATGLHQGSGKVLVTWDSGTAKWKRGPDKEQVSGYDTYFEPLSEADQEIYRTLWKATKAARDAQFDFEQAHKIALHGTVREAVDAELHRQVEAEIS